MPPDSNNMEELLKACAKERREQAGAPFELHPVNRRLLQEAVVKLDPAARGRRTDLPRRTGLFWFLFSGAATASIAVCAYIVMQPEPSVPGSQPQLVSLPSSHAMQAAPVSLAFNGGASDQDSNERNLSLSRRDSGTEAGNVILSGSLEVQSGLVHPEAVGISSTTPSGLAIVTISAPVSPAGVADLSGGALTSFPIMAPEPAAPAFASDSSATGAMPAVPGDSLAKNMGGTATPGTSDEQSASDMPAPSVTMQAPSATPASGAASDAATMPPDASKLASDLKAQDGAPVAGQAAAQIPLVTILQNFSVAVDGDDIRLIDADGSVYTGKITVARIDDKHAIARADGQVFSNIASVEKQARNIAERAKAADLVSSGVSAGVSNGISNTVQAMQTQQAQQKGQKKDAQAAQKLFSFRVSGVNRKLKKVVTFNGSCIATAQAPAGGPATKNSEQKKADKNAQETSNPIARIQGAMQIGNGPQIDVDAIPIPAEMMKAKAGAQ